MDWENQRIEDIELLVSLTINKKLYKWNGTHRLTPIVGRDQEAEFNVLIRVLVEKRDAQKRALDYCIAIGGSETEIEFNESTIRHLESLIQKFTSCVKTHLT